MMKNYKFIDEDFLNKFLNQEAANVKGKRKSIFGLEIGIPPLKGKYSWESEKREMNQYNKIDALDKHLRQKSVLFQGRPNRYILNHKHLYIEERFTATELLISKSTISQKLEVEKSLSIWVSEPSPVDLTNREREWQVRGSFLYLTERYFNDQNYTINSGCSALQFLWNHVSGEENIFNSPKGEPLGRWNSEHPIQKLKKLGAKIGSSQEFISLYKIKYMTDEQAYIYNGKSYRTNDIWGYPIYIAYS